MLLLSYSSPRHLAPEERVCNMLFERISGQRDGAIAKEARVHARLEAGATAGLLACLAVIDERKAFRAFGYASMLEYCRRDLALTEDVAKKYLRAARICMAHPELFDMLADRRLSMSAVLTLGTWLDTSAAPELIAAAVGKSREEIEWLIAERFPQTGELQLEASSNSGSAATPMSEGAPGPACPSSAVESSEPQVPLREPVRVKPIDASRVALTVTLARATRDKITRAQELLGHEVAPNDIAIVLDRALDLLVVQLEKRKHGLHRKARTRTPKPSRRARHIPPDLRAQVYERDGGACMFVSDDGVRCGSRHALEYDHVIPIAQGGGSTLENLRLLCPAHNQLEAERRLGAGFMAQKRAAS